MKRSLTLLAVAILTLFTTTGLTPQPTGHWEMSYVSNNWSDYREMVYDNVVYGFEDNPYHLHPWGEWISSMFGWMDYSDPQNLLSNSEGVVRVRFDWVGGGTPPSNMSFTVHTEAYSWLYAPNGGYDDLKFEMYCDGIEGVSDIYSTGAWVEASRTRSGGIVTYGSSPVYYEVSITNNMSATVDNQSSVSTMSVFSIYDIQ